MIFNNFFTYNKIAPRLKFFTFLRLVLNDFYNTHSYFVTA